MRDAEKTEMEGAALAWTAAIYYTLMIAAFLIGLYGFFSLFWLAASAVRNGVQVSGSLF